MLNRDKSRHCPRPGVAITGDKMARHHRTSLCGEKASQMLKMLFVSPAVLTVEAVAVYSKVICV